MNPASRNALVASIGASLVYALLLAVGKVVPRYDCILLMALLVGVFRLLRDVPRRIRTIGLHAVTQILLLSFLVHLWTIGYEGRNAIFGGIIPWSDSFDYLDDSLRLVHGERFTEFSSKRPIFGVCLAFLLKASWGSLRFSLFVVALIGAFSVALGALEVWKTHGHRAAFVVFVVLLFFERRWTGFIQTEHVGLPLGVIGFTLFWRANECREGDPARAKRLVLLAMFALSTGLMARAGAFFVIPALGIWAARTLETERPAQLRYLGFCAAAALFGFALHKTVLFATGSGVTFSDYPGIAYGLLHGEDYTLLMQHHPELATMSVGDRVSASWSIVTADALAHPQLVVKGFASSFAGLFISPFGMFSYIWTNPDDHIMEHGGTIGLWVQKLGIYSLINAGVMGLIGGVFVLSTIYALYKLLWKNRGDDKTSMLRHAAIGVLLSAPFTPPWITSGMQVQTVTLTFVASISATMLLAGQGDGPVLLVLPDRLRWAPIGFAAFLALAVAWLRLGPVPAPYCDATTPHDVRPYWGTRVEVAASRSLDPNRIAESDLRDSLVFLGKHNPELVDSIEPVLHPGTTYVTAFDACDRRAKILVDDKNLLDRSSTFRTLNAKPLASPRILSVQPVEP